MADNVPITAGSGTNVAADDIGSVFYQRVKISHGPDGSATDVSTASRLPADAGQFFSVTVNPIPGVTTTAYADRDSIGTGVTIANAARVSGGSGMVQSISLMSDTTTATAGSVDVYLLSNDTTASTLTDNAALSIADGADAAKIVGVVNLDEAYVHGGGSVLCARNVNLPFVCSSGTNLYAALEHRATWTFASTANAIIQFGLVRD